MNEMNSKHELVATIDHQSQRIAELEEDRNTWKARYEFSIGERTKLERQNAELRKDAALFRKLLSYQYWHRQELVRYDDVRRAITLAPNKYRTAALAAKGKS